MTQHATQLVPFPEERMHNHLRNVSFAEAAELMLRGAGEDLNREGLNRTPARFAKAFDHLTAGYRGSVAETIGEGVFAAEGAGLVVVRNVEFFSLCEHHMLPFWGTASVAYFPGEKIIGLSKIPRLVDLFARRLQVQERITRQLADAMAEALNPRAVAVRVQAAHLCVMMRGVEKQQSQTVTEAHHGMDTLSESERSRVWNAL